MNLKDFAPKLKLLMEAVLEHFSSKENMQVLGDNAAALIKKRTRLGYGVDQNGGTKAKLKPLSPGYKKQRKADGVASTTTPNKSNLTNTGAMLDNISAKATTGKVTIGFPDKAQEQKAEWVTEGGRPFNYLSEAEVKQLQNQLEAEVKKQLKTIFGSIK